MSEHEEREPAEVLKARRLEIVDDKGKVRAVLGTNEEGVTSLSMFDQSGRMRASLDASEVPEQMNGLGIFDTNGALQIAMGAYATSEKGGGFYCYGPNGEHRAGLNVGEQGSGLYCCDSSGERRAGLGVNEGEQAGLSLSAAQNDRHIKLGAAKDGNLYLMLTESGTPMVGLMLGEGEDNVLSSNLAFMDKDGRGGVVISGGRSWDPHVRLIDRRQKVRGHFGLGAGGEPRLYFADEEGKPIDPRNAFERVVADRGVWYQTLLFAAVLISGGIVGAWAANTASVSIESLPAAIITVIVLVGLSGLLFIAHRRGW